MIPRQALNNAAEVVFRPLPGITTKKYSGAMDSEVVDSQKFAIVCQ